MGTKPFITRSNMKYYKFKDSTKHQIPNNVIKVDFVNKKRI